VWPAGWPRSGALQIGHLSVSCVHGHAITCIHMYIMYVVRGIVLSMCTVHAVPLTCTCKALVQRSHGGWCWRSHLPVGKSFSLERLHGIDSKALLASNSLGSHVGLALGLGLGTDSKALLTTSLSTANRTGPTSTDSRFLFWEFFEGDATCTCNEAPDEAMWVGITPSVGSGRSLGCVGGDILLERVRAARRPES